MRTGRRWRRSRSSARAAGPPSPARRASMVRHRLYLFVKIGSVVLCFVVALLVALLLALLQANLYEAWLRETVLLCALCSALAREKPPRDLRLNATSVWSGCRHAVHLQARDPGRAAAGAGAAAEPRALDATAAAANRPHRRRAGVPVRLHNLRLCRIYTQLHVVTDSLHYSTLCSYSHSRFVTAPSSVMSVLCSVL